MGNFWDDKHYNSLNYFLRNKFGEKIFKISLDAGFSCPNRDGTISTGGCIFCSERGSGDFVVKKDDIIEQFYEGKDLMNKKWKSGKYIGYFQAFTNTYASLNILHEKYNSIIELEDVVGIAIATRPDCIDDEIINLLSELSKKTYVWVELGLQTMHNDTAILINRGYKLDAYVKVVEKLKSKNIDVVTHVIFGLPTETREKMLETIDFVANTGTQGIKLHLLHVMKNTKLEQMLIEDKLKLLEKDEYINLVVASIERLPKEMVIHRLTGDSPRNLLIGPMWSLNKWEILNGIDDKFKEQNTYQGKKYIRK